MGLFPHPIGKQFSRARTGASWGTHPRPRLPGRENGRKADARVGSCRTLHLYPTPQDVVLTRMYLGRGVRFPVPMGENYAESWIRTSENAPSTRLGE